MTDTYTVHINGDVIGTGLSLEDAAIEKLTHDSQQFEIRTDERGGFTLWTKSLNFGWKQTVIFSLEDTIDAARADIFEQVRRADWRRNPSIDTDTEYARRAADAEADA